MRRAIFVIAAVIAATGAGLAQVATSSQMGGQTSPPRIPPPLTPTPLQPGQQIPTFRARVDLIQVDVSVLDANRRPVRGLTASDFTVIDNGKPQPVSAFVEMYASDPTAPAGSWMRTVVPDIRVNNAEDGRVLLLVLDDGRMPPLAQSQFRPNSPGGTTVGPDPETATKQVARAIVERLGPADLAAVIFTAKNKNEQEFTSDRNRLLAAIDGFEAIPGSHFSERRALDTFKDAAEFLAEIPDRRKAIILIGPGTPGVILPGSPVIINSHFGDGDTQDAFLAAIRGNVTFYTINPLMMKNIEPEVERLLDPQAAQAAPGQTTFAKPTSEPPKPEKYEKDVHRLPLDQLSGGFTIRGPDQLVDGIQQIFRETGSYYLLGYTNPDAKDDGKPRKIEVKVNRPDLFVRSRTEWVPPKPVNTKKPASAAWKAIAGLLPAKDIPMRINATTFAIPGKKEVGVAIVLGLREPLPVGATDPVDETVYFLTQAYTTNGDPRGPSQQTVASLKLIPNPRGEAKYEVLSLLKLKPGRYHLRLSATSRAQGKSGSIYYDIEIPDYAKLPLSLSGVVVSTSPPLVAGPKDAVSAVIPVIPTTQREFQGHSGQAFVRVYQGGKMPVAPVRMLVTIRDVANSTKLSVDETLGVGRFDVTRAADYRFDIPVARLTPGNYLLTFEASSPGLPPVRQDVRFTVREPLEGR